MVALLDEANANRLHSVHVDGARVLFARLQREEASNAIEKDRLARSTWPDDGRDLATLERATYVVQGGHSHWFQWFFFFF